MASTATVYVSVTDMEPVKSLLAWIASDDLRQMILNELEDVDWHEVTEPGAARLIANQIRLEVAAILKRADRG